MVLVFLSRLLREGTRHLTSNSGIVMNKSDVFEMICSGLWRSHSFSAVNSAYIYGLQKKDAIACKSLFLFRLQKTRYDYVFCGEHTEKLNIFHTKKDTGLQGLSFSHFTDPLKNEWRHISSCDTFSTR